jgi:hypothetical protein
MSRGQQGSMGVGAPPPPNPKLSPGGLPIPPGRLGTPGTPPDLTGGLGMGGADPMGGMGMGGVPNSGPTSPVINVPAPPIGGFGGPFPAAPAPPPQPFAPTTPPPEPPPTEMPGMPPPGGAMGGATPYQKPGGDLAAKLLGMGKYKPTPQGTTNYGKISPGGLPQGPRF